MLTPPAQETPASDHTGPADKIPSSPNATMRTPAWWLFFVAAALAAAWPLYLILHFGVNHPWSDDWEVASFILKAHDKTLKASDFWLLHNEHRILTANLTLLPTALLTDWNIRAEMMLGWFFVCFLTPVYALLCRATFSGLSRPEQAMRPTGFFQSVPLWLWFWLLVHAMVFSPIQYENFLSGFNSNNFMCPLFLTAACTVLHVRRLSWATILLAAVFVELAVLTIANGLIGWIVFLPLVAYADSWRGVLQKRAFIAGWLALAGLSFATYFWDYRPHVLSDVYYPATIATRVQYFFSFLGAPLSFAMPGSFGASRYVGGALLLLFLGCFAACVKRLRAGEFDLVRRMLPWIALGAYPIGCAMLGAIGRAGIGADQSMRSRYTTMTLSLLIALAALFTLLAQSPRESEATKRDAAAPVRRAWPGWLPGVFVAAMLLALGFSSAWAVDMCERTRRMRQAGRAHLAFITMVREPSSEFLVHDRPDLREMAMALDAIGCITPPLVKNPDIRELMAPGAESPEQRPLAGLVEHGQRTANQMLQFAGWAAIPHQNRPADAVLTTYANPRGEQILCGISNITAPRADIAKAQGEAMLYCGWIANIPPERLPPGPQAITCWAYDSLNRRAYPISFATARAEANPTPARRSTAEGGERH